MKSLAAVDCPHKGKSMHRYLEYILTKVVCWKRKKAIPHGSGKGFLVLIRYPLGDTMTVLPLLRELKRSFPATEITAVCAPSNKNLLAASPCIDRLLVYDDRAQKSYCRVNLRRTWDFAREYLWQTDIGAAIVPTTCMPSMVDAWLAFFSGASRRFSYTERTNKTNHRQYMGAYDALFTKILEAHGEAHEVERNLMLVSAAGGSVADTGMPVWLTEEDERCVDDLLAAANLPLDTRRVIVNLSTSHPSKDWPVERYVSVCRTLSARYPLSLLLVGAGKSAEKYAKTFCREVSAYNFIGRTTIRQTLALMKRADFYLGGDTGPAHFAAACGLRGVVIYKVGADIQNMEQNYPVRLYPWQSDLTMLQPENVLPGCEQGCLHTVPHCILQVTEEQVLRAMQDSIGIADKMKSVRLT